MIEIVKYKNSSDIGKRVYENYIITLDILYKKNFTISIRNFEIFV